MEETGVSECIKTGTGLVTFRDANTALAMLEGVEANYSEHAKGARNIAESLFSTRVVLPDLLEAAFP